MRDKKMFYNLGILLFPVILLVSACNSSCQGDIREEIDVRSSDFEEVDKYLPVFAPREVFSEVVETVYMDMDSMSFGDAFNWQWRAKHLGEIFWWRGEQYVIRLKDE